MDIGEGMCYVKEKKVFSKLVIVNIIKWIWKPLLTFIIHTSARSHPPKNTRGTRSRPKTHQWVPIVLRAAKNRVLKMQLCIGKRKYKGME